jgi:hypothetical protein
MGMIGRPGIGDDTDAFLSSDHERVSVRIGELSPLK